MPRTKEEIEEWPAMMHEEKELEKELEKKQVKE